MPTMRTCCCTVTELGKPLLVRSGWYHFLVLTESGGVSCLIGNPTRTRHDNETFPTNTGPGEPSTSTGSWCTDAAVPIEAPAGHPLHVPAGIKSSSRNGSAIKDITCGAYHNLVRTSDNRILAWGLNSMGQCNVPDALANGTHPKAARIVGLHAGYSTSAVTFNDGSVLCWGDPVVAEQVNKWTDLMMSPVNIQADSGKAYNETNNVAADNVKFAKPYYEAAYSTTVTETWNLLQDPNSKWHGASAPNPRWNLDAATHACVPFFDLGVETDPAHPLEFKTYGFERLNDVFPGMGVWNPSNWNSPTPPPCYNETNCLDHPERFGDWLSMYWRNLMFNTSDGRKSCCDLQIKRDFAVGLKRTGQVITYRPTDGGLVNPNRNTSHCTAVVNSCRDCSADKDQILMEPGEVDYQSSCTSPFYPGQVAQEGDLVSQASCACIQSYVEGDPLRTSGYNKSGCPKCPGFTCAADRRFSLTGICGGDYGSSPRMYEGIGCIASSIRAEQMLYDPNWARNFASPSMSSAMYQPGEQVRHISSLNYHPSINGPNIQENWGWSTKPTGDIVQTQDTSCVTRHSSNSLTSEPFCHEEKDRNGQTVCAGGQAIRTCKAVCKSSTAEEYSPDPMKPEGTALWQYPVQFFSNGVLAGTNTTVWTSVPDTIKALWSGGKCASCNAVNASNCYDDKFQREDINQGATGGYVTYGCIYAGSVYNHPNSFDKYQDANSYSNPSSSTFNMPPPCADFSSKLNSIFYLKAPSKPWGPFSFVMTNAFGEKSVPGLNPCHCFTSDFQNDDGVPNQACNGIGLYPPPNLLRIAGYDTLLLDKLLGTFDGFPREANLSCRLAPVDGRPLTFSSSEYVSDLCNGVCGNYGSHWAGKGHGVVPAFCMHNAFISYASGRLSFAVVRADHRRHEDTGGRMVPDQTHNYPPRQVNGVVVTSDPYGPLLNGTRYVDPSQHPGCSCTSGGPNGTYNCTPYVPTEWVLHVWGNLWDPCPPWPRLCDDTRIPSPQAGAGCASEWNPSSLPLETDPGAEMNWTPADELNPTTAKGWGPCALYPQWTRLPTNPSPGAPKSYFSSKRGAWQKVSGSWAWVVAEDAPCEPSVSDTMYCPDCSAWTQNYATSPGYVSEWYTRS